MKPRKSRVAPLQGRSWRTTTIRTIPPTPLLKDTLTIKVINGITHIRSRLDDGPRWIPLYVKVKTK